MILHSLSTSLRMRERLRFPLLTLVVAASMGTASVLLQVWLTPGHSLKFLSSQWCLGFLVLAAFGVWRLFSARLWLDATCTAVAGLAIVTSAWLYGIAALQFIGLLPPVVMLQPVAS